jgi:tetratricopeptide (TPR) repeat protein
MPFFLLLLFFPLAACLFSTGCAHIQAPPSRSTEQPPAEGEPLAAKDRAYGLFLRARAFEMMGNIPAAAEGYERAAQADSEAYSLRYWLSRYYLEKNEPEKALAHLTYVIQRDSQPEYLVSYGVLLVQLGRLSAAESAIQSALDKTPQDPRIKEMLASLYEKGGEIDQAIALYQSLRQQPEYQAGAEEKLLSLYVQLRRIPEALAMARTLLERNPNSAATRLSLFSLGNSVPPTDSLLAVYKKALESYPDNINLKKDLASLLIKWDRLREADSLYGQMMKEHPEAVDRKMYGILLASQNKPGQAIPILESLLKEKPDVDAAFYLGNAYLETKRYPEAVGAYSACLASDTTNLSAWMNKGIAFLRMDRFDSAQALFKSLTVRFPADAENDYMLGVAFGAEKNYAAAREAYASALRKHPDNQEILFSLASVQERLGDFTSAEKLFLAILAKDSLNGRALNYLGYMYAEKGSNWRWPKSMSAAPLSTNPAMVPIWTAMAGSSTN